jgi:hypothetical protein
MNLKVRDDSMTSNPKPDKPETKRIVFDCVELTFQTVVSLRSIKTTISILNILPKITSISEIRH